MTRVFVILAVLGAALPLSQFLPWFAANGLDLHLFFDELFANRISSFFGLDVLVSAIVTAVLIVLEGRRAGVPRLWMPIAGTFLIGVSLGLPMFLAMREIALDRPASAN
jgi:hypothetical protein